MSKKHPLIRLGLYGLASYGAYIYYKDNIRNKSYSGIGRIPTENASEKITEGCLVLEGGSLRGLYTSGVLDALMENDINFQTTIGVSAGALNGANYVSGQIGRSARFNLSNRFNQRYFGIAAFIENRSPFGFRYMFSDTSNVESFNYKRFNDPKRRFVAVATNISTARPVYFEKNKCSDIFTAMRCSATLPVLSEPVHLEGGNFLDGGCSMPIAYQWAIDQGFEKIVVVRTRTRGFRKPEGTDGVATTKAEEFKYRNYPDFLQELKDGHKIYNRQCEELLRLEKEGRLFQITPSTPPTVSRLDSDLEKIGALYDLGVKDTNNIIPKLKEYLES